MQVCIHIVYVNANFIRISTCRSLGCWIEDKMNSIGSFSSGHEFKSKKLSGKMSGTISIGLLIKRFEVYDNWSSPVLLLFTLVSLSRFKFMDDGSSWVVVKEEILLCLGSEIRGESWSDFVKVKGTFEEKNTFCFCGDSALKI